MQTQSANWVELLDGIDKTIAAEAGGLRLLDPDIGSGVVGLNDSDPFWVQVLVTKSDGLEKQRKGT